MKYQLQFLVIAPDAELARAGETYKLLIKEIDLSYTPFIGLSLHLSSGIMEDDPDIERYRHLDTIAYYYSRTSNVYYCSARSKRAILDSEIGSAHQKTDLFKVTSL